ncbi:SCO2102 family sporulation regulator [Streptomyces mexicanus]|uniref:SCO2102 family sporulation regulator n=1 Tax=Streptomyces mexicanus TaxID=178566 RepID=UPI0036A7467A
MGWAVLYIAFGGVALWLLGEVLLQYKARLRWRLLAFGGFLCVVLGVLMPSVLVIGLGAAAFAVGQTYVTLSFRRGFAAGWAVRRPGAGKERPKRRRGRGERTEAAPGAATAPDAAHPGLNDTGQDDFGHDDAGNGAPAPSAAPAYGPESDYDADYDRDDVFTPVRHAQPTAAETTAVYEPQPLPDDTGNYGVYDTGYGGADRSQEQYATAAQTTDHAYGYDYSGYGGTGQGYDGTGHQGYAGYTEPYPGTPAYGDASYDPGYAAQQGYGEQQPYGTQDPYATGGYGGETPAGGVWVPQQRTDDSYGDQLPPEQPYPYPGTGPGQAQHGAGFDEQYRF